MCKCFYVKQFQLVTAILSLDAVCFVVRIYFYFIPSIVLSSTVTIQPTILLKGFILDYIGSIISASALAIMGLLLAIAICLKCVTGQTGTAEVFGIVGLTPMRRLLTMRCNCPCYRTRPKLRFIIRFILLILCIIFRMVAAILYSKGNFQVLTIMCTVSEVALILPLIIDIYHYCVWWHYRPGIDNGGRHYSSKHKRFLPYHLLGKNRDEHVLGDEPCKNVKCENRKLEHVLIYHRSDHQPQQRWPEIKDKTNVYIGFHRTSADAAIKIAHTDMNPSTTPPQMLGFGIYFARSIKHTEGKARHGTHGGGIICAKIRMGRVLEINQAGIPDVRNSNAWHADYDTVYYTQNNEERDEFRIKSSDQILKWVMVIEEGCDPKVRDYGLDTEFANTRCGCI